MLSIRSRNQFNSNQRSYSEEIRTLRDNVYNNNKEDDIHVFITDDDDIK